MDLSNLKTSVPIVSLTLQVLTILVYLPKLIFILALISLQSPDRIHSPIILDFGELPLTSILHPQGSATWSQYTLTCRYSFVLYKQKKNMVKQVEMLYFFNFYI